jgi:hypothetical protein
MNPFSWLTVTFSVALALFASTASAAPPPAELSVPLQLGAITGETLGASSLRTTFTDSSATAEASAPAITLAKGSVYRIYTCIQTHINWGTHATKCAQKDVDTRSSLVTVITSGPTVTASVKRPPSGQWGYAYHQVAVTKKASNGSYTYVGGTSSAGLENAALPLPAIGALTGVLPPSQGLDFPGSGVGGINTGNPDSMCMGQPKQGTYISGVSTTKLGSGAPAFYEVGEPTGAFAGKPPKGVMLLIHGGGWSAYGSGHVAPLRGAADRWRARGWRTLNLSYRSCELAMDDVKWFYDRARSLWGSELPYCVLGESAGGNLALLLAAKRSSVSCVINQAGITNGETLGDQGAYDVNTGGSQTKGPRWVYNSLMAAVGVHNVYWYSAVNFHIQARVLSATAERDPLIPLDQATGLRESMLARDPNAYSDVMTLGVGSATKFAGHAGVSQDALDDYYRHEEELVAPLVGQ